MLCIYVDARSVNFLWSKPPDFVNRCVKAASLKGLRDYLAEYAKERTATKSSRFTQREVAFLSSLCEALQCKMTSKRFDSSSLKLTSRLFRLCSELSCHIHQFSCSTVSKLPQADSGQHSASTKVQSALSTSAVVVFTHGVAPFLSILPDAALIGTLLLFQTFNVSIYYTLCCLFSLVLRGCFGGFGSNATSCS